MEKLQVLNQTRVRVLPWKPAVSSLPRSARIVRIKVRANAASFALRLPSQDVSNNWVNGKQLPCSGFEVKQGFRAASLVKHKSVQICSSYESSSGGGNSHVEDGDNDTIEYLEAQVVDAVSMVPLHGKLLMTLGNGKEMEVDHINPTKGRLLYKSSTPTIFLKVTDGSDLMLPIVVGEGAVTMLMKALHDDEHLGRPNHYHLMRDMVGALQYEARMVRITERVGDTYYARIYIGKPGEEELFSVDARPSDAINLAVRCKIPIYVSSKIIEADAVRPVMENELTKRLDLNPRKRNSIIWEIASEPDTFTDEVTMVLSMLVAVAEERYKDAAHWRDELARLRSNLKGKLRRI